MPAPESFEDLVALFWARKEGRLAVHLSEHLQLVRYAPGVLEFRPGPDAPPKLAGTLGGLLQDWTGRRWMVSVSDSEAAQPTLAAQRQAAEAAEREEVLRHPLVQAALETFPGAELLEVRHKPGGEASGESSEEGDAGT